MTIDRYPKPGWNDSVGTRSAPAAGAGIRLECTTRSTVRRARPRSLFLSLVTGLLMSVWLPAALPAEHQLFARTNLVAWCIVPFDAKKRGPEERAAMLERLGFKCFAYDYRAEHVPTFDAELEALQRHHVQLLAWWFPTTLNDEARAILSVL